MRTLPQMTPRQAKALRRVFAACVFRGEHSESVSPDVARQLLARGLVELDYANPSYTRAEWNRPVATLWNVRFNPSQLEQAACAVMCNGFRTD